MIPPRLSSVFSEALVALAARFEEAGYPLYLVGGSVRDALLDRESEDLDFTTSARPDAIESIGAGWASSSFTAGKEFGTIGLVRSAPRSTGTIRASPTSHSQRAFRRISPVATSP